MRSASRRAHYRKHLELFPDGQFVVLDGDRVVGATTTLRLHFDFDHLNHTFADIIQGGWLTSHEPDGDWLYGADIGVHPAYRGRGLATALYAARQEAVWRLGLKGQVTAGMMRGYGAVKDRMTAAGLLRGASSPGRINDPTLSMQLGVGFEPRALLANYLNDPVSRQLQRAASCSTRIKDVRGRIARRTPWRYIRLKTDDSRPTRAAICSRAAPPRRRPASAGPPTSSSSAPTARSSSTSTATRSSISPAASACWPSATRRPPVVEAIHDQAAEVHAILARWSPPTSRTCGWPRLLNEITPGTFTKKTILANSGAEAVENAVKLARKYTGRPVDHLLRGRLSRPHAAHAEPHEQVRAVQERLRTVRARDRAAADSATSTARRPGMTEEQYVDFGIRQLEHALVAQVDPAAVAAMIIEPVQGEAGFIPVPPRFLQRIRELCTEHGIVMIADEVQCGMGRTGRLFALEHYGIVPDLVTTPSRSAPACRSRAVTGRAEIMDAAHLGGIGGTYGGSPVACAAAIEAVEIIRQPAFLAHARRLGDVMREVMERLEGASGRSSATCAASAR